MTVYHDIMNLMRDLVKLILPSLSIKMPPKGQKSTVEPTDAAPDSKQRDVATSSNDVAPNNPDGGEPDLNSGGKPDVNSSGKPDANSVGKARNKRSTQQTKGIDMFKNVTLDEEMPKKPLKKRQRTATTVLSSSECSISSSSDDEKSSKSDSDVEADHISAKPAETKKP